MSPRARVGERLGDHPTGFCGIDLGVSIDRHGVPDHTRDVDPPRMHNSRGPVGEQCQGKRKDDRPSGLGATCPSAPNIATIQTAAARQWQSNHAELLVSVDR